MAENKKILVVDDNQVICDSVAKVLSHHGYEVECATDSQLALEKIKATQYGLVIVDIMMPKLGGLDFLKQIRKQYKQCNVIMIAGYPTIESAVQAAKNGALGYVPKPFTPDELLNAVSKALADASGKQASEKKLIWYYEKNNQVLVVDDEEVICNSVKKILGNEGYYVETALTTDDALVKLKGKRYALALLDLKIPSIGGVELLRKIKESWPDTRAIIITGYASIDSALETTKLGAFSYIQKPFTPDELKVAVRSAMSLKAI